MSSNHQRRAERRSDFERMAAEAFKDHIITQEAPDRWYCGKPGTGIYSFRVCAPPGAVVLYGDIGEIILRPSDRDSLSWLRAASHLDYALGKAPEPTRRRTFLAAEARFYLAELRGADDDAANPRLADAIEAEWLAVLDEPGEGAIHEWLRACHVAGDDDPPACDDWCASMIWCWHGLRCFVRLLEDQQTVAAEERR